MRNVTPLTLDDFETQPFRVAGTQKLDADPLAVFAELGDPSLWFPLMRRSVWKTAATSGVGAEREIDNRMFGRARERMLAWDPGARVAFTMTQMSSPLVETFGEDYRLVREGAYTRLDWLVVATPSRLGRPLVPVLRRTMHLMFTRACKNIGTRARSFNGETRGKQVS